MRKPLDWRNTRLKSAYHFYRSTWNTVGFRFGIQKPGKWFRFRMITALVLVVLGLCMLLFWSSEPDSDVFAVFSGALFFAALWFAFRVTHVAVVLGTISVFIFGMVKAYKVISIGVIPLAFILLTTGSLFLSKWIMRKYRIVTMQMYQSHEQVIGVDTVLIDFMPLEAYTFAIRVEVNTDEKMNDRALQSFLDSLELFAKKRALVFAGIIADPADDRFTLYLFTDSYEKAKKPLLHFLKRKIHYPFSVELLSETAEDIYFGVLYPSAQKRGEMSNQITFEQLEINGFDFHSEQIVTYYAQFFDKETAESYYMQAKSLFHFNQAELNEENETFFVELSIKQQLFFPTVNGQTRALIALVEQLNGEFQGWQIGDEADKNV